ncbi:MAG: MBOAT family protein [Dysgonamonadaceae bacterium]|jgi:D-alanyl-lipoteichoic acid acyltransferase DltB (MBOAT superfamily)|nr:MBOAT family protein [Dysgonamonadaceae bacterium]
MIFNSIPFVLFFVVFFAVYWLSQKKIKLQNGILLAGSYFFYAWWDWRFLLLLIACTAVSYFLGIKIHSSEGKAKSRWLLAGILIEAGALVYFKYTNFFIQSLLDLAQSCHISLSIHTLRILLPLGISFYIFRILSYLLDVYYQRVPPERDTLVYFGYVAFFPSLVSGPIDRAKTLMPQLKNKRTFDSGLAADGTRQILWGLFKKAVIADNCAMLIDPVFSHSSAYPASTLWLSAFLYTMQLYADFSGYSDMAIGIAKLLGFRITRNFQFPFFAQNIADYWRRWHISLTTWLTDFIFTPASIRFRNWGNFGLILAIVITFLVSGIWHGANWTFVLWGFLHGCYYIPLILRGTMHKKRKLPPGILPSRPILIRIFSTFALVLLTNIIFRSASIAEAFAYYKGLVNASIVTMPVLQGNMNVFALLLFVFIMLIIEWLQRDKEFGLQIGDLPKRAWRWAIYYGIVLLIVFYGTTNTEFIYFQF